MKRGFTIVELLIYSAIIVSLLLVLGNILISTLSVQLESQASSLVEADGRYLLSRLAYDIRRADSVAIPAQLGQSATSLQLDLAGQPITYSLTGTDLILTTPDSDGRVNSFGTQVSDWSVTRLGNLDGIPTLQINFTLTQIDESRSFQITLGLRDQE